LKTYRLRGLILGASLGAAGAAILIDMKIWERKIDKRGEDGNVLKLNWSCG